jgi:hypothetical protein
VNSETNELITREFGYGVRHSEAPQANDRYNAGFDHLSTVVQRRLHEIAPDDTLGPVDYDLLRAALCELSIHQWKMIAIGLFNHKEEAA